MIRKISNNISLEVKNLHITLQHNGKLCTLHIDDIKINSCNHLWEESFVEPGKHNFMRKNCTLQGVHLKINDCNIDGEETIHREPIIQELDAVIRAAIIKERFSPKLPDNRIDFLCLRPLALNLTTEQYKALLDIIGLFTKKKTKKKILPRADIHSISEPNIAKDKETPPPSAQKGWISWVMSAIKEEESDLQ